MRALITAALLLLSPAQARQVTATVYHGWFHSRTTYCGQIFQLWGRKAPFFVRYGMRPPTVDHG